MTASNRLERLYPALTLEERFAILLDACHADQELDVQVLWTLPGRDGPGWNRLLDVLQATAVHLGWYIDYLAATVSRAELLHALWLTIRMEATRAEAAHLMAVYGTPEPVTEREYGETLAASRLEIVPLEALAQELVENAQAGEEVDDRRWNRLLAEAARRLRSQVKAGTLSAVRKDGHLLITRGSFDDWCGVPTVAIPDRGSGFDVFPDEQAGLVATLREQQEDRRVRLLERREIAFRRERELREAVTGELEGRWHELRVAELVLERLADVFGGRNPLHPDDRSRLAACRERLLALRGQQDSEPEFAEPPEHLVERLFTLLAG